MSASTAAHLGDGETGGHVAAPIFRDFMAEALKGAPAKDFPEPGKELETTENQASAQPTPPVANQGMKPPRP